MDLMTLVAGLAGALAASVALALTMRSVQSGAVQVGDKRVVSYGRPLKAMVTAFWLFGLALMALGMFAPAEDRMLAFVVVTGLLASIGYLHLEFFYVRIGFDEEGMVATAPWRRMRVVPWSVVRRVEYPKMWSWYVIETNGYGRIRLSILLNGIDDLIDELKARGVPVADGPVR